MSFEAERLLAIIGECPECGEELTGGSVRWNGQYWEHKSSEAHPQAGHHAMAPERQREGLEQP